MARYGRYIRRTGRVRTRYTPITKYTYRTKAQRAALNKYRKRKRVGRKMKFNRKV